MVKIALIDREGLELCTYELDQERVCYTIDTLRALRDGPPPCRPVFLMGMDSLRQIGTWRSPEAILREFDLAVFDRGRLPLESIRDDLHPEARRRLRVLPEEGPEDPEGLEPGRGGRVLYLPAPAIPISSSDIRARAAAGLELAGLVPDGVARYIRDTGLYHQEVSR